MSTKENIKQVISKYCMYIPVQNPTDEGYERKYKLKKKNERFIHTDHGTTLYFKTFVKSNNLIL